MVGKRYCLLVKKCWHRVEGLWRGSGDDSRLTVLPPLPCWFSGMGKQLERGCIQLRSAVFWLGTDAIPVGTRTVGQEEGQQVNAEKISPRGDSCAGGCLGAWQQFVPSPETVRTGLFCFSVPPAPFWKGKFSKRRLSSLTRDKMFSCSTDSINKQADVTNPLVF